MHFKYYVILSSRYYDPKDRSRKISVELSMKYMESVAYRKQSIQSKMPCALVLVSLSDTKEQRTLYRSFTLCFTHSNFNFFLLPISDLLLYVLFLINSRKSEVIFIDWLMMIRSYLHWCKMTTRSYLHWLIDDD